jgi:hypothetical protein
VEFTIHHRRERLEAVYDALVRQRIGRARGVCWVLAIASMGALLMGWPWMALWGPVCGGSLVAVAGLGVMRDETIKQVREQFELVGADALHYRVEDEGLYEASRLGEGRMRWLAFAAPREVAGHLLLPRKPEGAGGYIALPLDQIGPEVRQALEDRIRGAAQTPVG